MRLSFTAAIHCFWRGLVCKWTSHTFPAGMYRASSFCQRAKFKSQIQINSMDERHVCTSVSPQRHWVEGGGGRKYSWLLTLGARKGMLYFWCAMCPSVLIISYLRIIQSKATVEKKKILAANKAAKSSSTTALISVSRLQEQCPHTRSFYLFFSSIPNFIWLI